MLQKEIIKLQAIVFAAFTVYRKKGALPMDNKTPRKKSVLKQSSVLNSIIHPIPSKEDPNGMYTGLPIEYGEIPVQDADDL